MANGLRVYSGSTISMIFHNGVQYVDGYSRKDLLQPHRLSLTLSLAHSAVPAKKSIIFLLDRRGPTPTARECRVSGR